MKHPICIDFETEAIESRPKYPPVPVGLAIKWPGKKAKYLAWGHPTKNNCEKGATARELEAIWDSGLPILMHNAKYDLDVAETHFGLDPLPWDRVHDTLFTLFLLDPHAATLSLKPSAEKHLGMPPDEQDAVRDWLVEHRVIAANENHGAHIAKAPGDVVGRYAIGDVERTLKLHLKLYPKLDAGMRRAYDRERELLPILLENERQGLRVDVAALERDVPIYQEAMRRVEASLRKKLKSPNLNFDDDKGVGDALFNSKVVTDWVWTKGGGNRAPQRSVAKANLGAERFNDKKIFAELDYRNRLQTQLSMSMVPWLNQARSTGRIYTEWNQVRQSHGKEMAGARTGRLSCSRFMNITKKFTDHTHPKWLKGLPELPLVRKYILPEEGHIWIHRDYKQQEFKWLAHFEDADLKAAYLANPELDQHDAMLEKLVAGGYIPLPKGASEEERKEARDMAKTLNLAILYALGLLSLSLKLKTDTKRAGALRLAVKRELPGVALLEAEVKRRAAKGEPVRTWGGRLLYCKPPSVAKTGARKGELVTYEYTLLNHLIQGSAADNTKEAIIRYNKARKKSRLLIMVHDEINISAPVADAAAESRILGEAMESIECDVALLTDEKRGSNWGSLEKVK